MADDFERAVLCVFDASVSREQRAQATGYLDGLRAGPAASVWCAAARAFAATQHAEVRFWSLQTLVGVVSQHHAKLGEADVALLATNASQWLLACGPHSQPHVRAKCAQLFAALLAVDLREASASLSAFAREASAPALAALLEALSEDHLSLESSLDATQRSDLKDRLRDALPTVCQAVVSRVHEHGATSPHEAAAVLSSFRGYVCWIDTALVAGEEALPPLGILLQAAALPPASPELRAAALGCLQELFAKNMALPAKLALLRRFNAVEVATSATQDDCAAAALEFAAVTACEYLPECGVAAEGECEEALDALVRFCAALAARVESEDGDLPPAMHHLLSAWLARLRRVAEAGAVPPRLSDTLAMLLRLLHSRTRYPPEDDEPALREECEQRVAATRASLAPLLRAAARADPAATCAYVAAALRSVTAATSSTAWVDVESSLQLVLDLGEQSAQSPAAAQLLASASALTAGVVHSGVPHAQHRRVSGAFLELCVRYGASLARDAPQLLPVALHAFLDQRGVRHADAHTAGRAAYLLTRFAKPLQSQLAPHGAAAAAALLPALEHIAASPPPFRLKATGGTQPPDERLCAFQAMPLLLSGCAEEALTAARIAAALAARAEEQAAACQSGCVRCVASLAHALDALAALLNGLQGRARGEGLRQPLASALSAAALAGLRLRAPPLSAECWRHARARALALLHRGMDSLGEDVQPALPLALRELWRGADGQPGEAECVQAAALLTQALKSSPPLALLAEALPAIAAASAHAAALSRAGGSSDERCREATECVRAWNALMYAVATRPGAAQSLRLEPAASAFSEIADRLAADAGSHPLLSVRRTALGSLTALLRASPALVGPHFAAQRLGGDACLVPILRGDLDLRDAATALLLGDVSTALAALSVTFPEEWARVAAALLEPCAASQALPLLTANSVNAPAFRALAARLHGRGGGTRCAAS